MYISIVYYVKMRCIESHDALTMNPVPPHRSVSAKILTSRSSGRQRAMKISAMHNSYYLGIDFGTSGARSCVIDEKGSTIALNKISYASSQPNQLASAWKDAIFHLVSDIPNDIKSEIASIAIDGTSATAVLIDGTTGEMMTYPKMYNEAQDKDIVQLVKDIAPPDHTVTSSTSTLCKLMAWHHKDRLLEKAIQNGKKPILLHQADWLGYLLHGKIGYTDYNNCLKLGYDPEKEEYPSWMLHNKLIADALPRQVVAPGTKISAIQSTIAQKTGLSSNCIVCAGTTDSIAAFLAAGIDQPGQAVTSLGSTLAIKLLSTKRVENASYGVYSHRLGDTWLVGGASNTGCAVLRQYFTDDELAKLTARINIDNPTGLEYIVLPAQGERFPTNDPDLKPKLLPRPDDDALFLQGMLESMSRTEAQGYAILHNLGATPVCEVRTCGGGAKNSKWTEMRARALGVPVNEAKEGEAAYGAALLAKGAR